MSASEDTPRGAAPRGDRLFFVEGPGVGNIDESCNAIPTGSSQTFLPNPDARDDAYYAELRLSDAEFRLVRTPRSA